MSSKKYLFLTALLSLLTLSQVFGQSTPVSGHDYLDTSYVRDARMDQQRSFLNNESSFPAKPKDMWELGIHGGYNWIVGDQIPSDFGFGAGLSLRKAIGHTFSVRGDFGYLEAKGVGRSTVSARNLAGTGAFSAYGSNGQFYPDYKMTAGYAALDLVVSLNNIMFHKENPTTNWYLFGGYTALLYKTDMNALNGSSAYTGTYTGSRKEIVDQVKNAHDDSYETRMPTSRTTIKGKNLRHSVDGGVGVAFKISPRFNIGVEEKLIMPFDPELNGISRDGSGGKSRAVDLLAYTNVRLNFNLGNASKRTEPLYWENPLGYAYNELNSPRHMLLPDPVLPDSDGDGVTDQFDKCPDTPEGVPVDVNGCPLDTDGDGVPDYKDKELITPTYCQPVDEDGVGKCPEIVKEKDVTCDLGTLPSISFSGNSVTLSDDAKSLLSSVASQMRESPDCRVVVSGHAQSSKSSEQLAWDRVNSVINYLNEQEGIPASRFIFKYKGGAGDINTVDLRGATANDGGPNMVTPPHPNLRRSK